VSIDTFIGKSLRKLNRQVLTLTESPTGTELPRPRVGSRYLLYLHIPYCVVLCPFCSFHRVKFKKDDTAQYFSSLRREIELVSDRGYRFDELYVGGGTPTVMPGELVKTLRLVQDLHPLSSLSIETNPDDLDPDNLRRWRDAGVNRLSVGVQSFDDDLLRQMQRYDTYGSGSSIRNSLRRAEGIFETLNADIIFNFPRQTEASLHRDLNILIDELDIDQVSFYPLMTVNSTRRKMQQTVGDVDYSRERRYYQIIAERMQNAGYKRASAWCFSRRPGMFDEYIAEREEYVGLGSGSFSYLDGNLFASSFSINHYERLVASGKTGTVCHRRMSERDQMRYYLMMQLFSGKLSVADAEERFNGRFRGKLWPELAALRTMGSIRSNDRQITLTESGFYLWVMMMREFFTAVNTLREHMRHKIAEEVAILPGQIN